MSDNDFFGGRRRRRAGAAFSPYSLFASGEQGVWYDPSDLTPEKVSWRRNLLTYTQDFENAAWTKSNASILSNLALYSQDFDNAYWVKQSTTVTANNATAPDGTTTADTLTGIATFTSYINTGSIAASASTTYTVSAYVKAGTAAVTTLRVFDGGIVNSIARANVNWSGGVASLGTQTGWSSTPTLTDVGSGWYRIVGTFSTGIYTTLSVLYYPDGNSVGANSLLWGVQLVPGSTAQTYTRSLATAAPIQFADPLGGTLADKLVENTALNIHYQIQSLTALSPASKTYAVSAYLKDADGRFATLGISDVSTGTRYAVANFNLTNGTVAASAAEGTGYAVVSSSIENAGSGWYRCIVVCTAGTTVTSLGGVVGLSNQSAIPSGAGGFVTYTGNGTNGFFVYGAQVEQASTASAYQRITDFSSDFLAAFPTHALYQDSIGTTPVSALGQSVGLVIDKRLGGLTALGSTITSTGYTSTGSVSDNGNGTYTIQPSSTMRFNFPLASLENGATYLVTIPRVLTSGTGSSVSTDFVDGTSATIPNGGWSGTFTYISSRATYDATFRFVDITTGGTVAAIVGAPVLNKVPGNHAIQATSAARPTLQARSNLLTYTEQFDNAAWTKADSATVTANAVAAPDGTTTADQLNIAASELSRIQQSITAVVTPAYTYSVWLRTSSGTATLRFGDASLLSTITVTSDWQRFSQVISGLAGPGNFTIRNESGGGAKTIFAWGAQLELGTTASTYQRVTTATDYADVGLPRNLTFDGIDDSLATAGNVDFATWTVGSRRNLLTVPTMFDASPWGGAAGVTVTANATTAPDGTLTADNIAFATGGAAEFMRQSVAMTAGATYTASVYARLISGSATFTLDLGNTLTSGAFTPTSSWQRFEYTAVFSGATQWLDIQASGPCTIAFWGAQLEVGSTATAFQDVGTDKVTLFSGVTKLSDAAAGMIVELSANQNSNAGGFYVSAAETVAGNYGTRIGGNRGYNNATFVAPITNVISLAGDLAASGVTTGGVVARFNGIVNTAGVAGTTMPGGNFGSYLLYVGRRASTTFPFNGRLFQLVIRGAATDSVTVGNAERWVGQLTGVNL